MTIRPNNRLKLSERGAVWWSHRLVCAPQLSRGVRPIALVIDTMQDIILISGVPASGKSYFCDWLERAESFLHFDVEKDGRLEERGLKPLWDRCFSVGTAGPLVKALRTLGSPLVLNWGFPPECLSVVALLKREGVSIWWFDAVHADARRAFIKQGDVPLECFDQQINKIVCAWPRIKALFEPNIVTTLGQDDKRPSTEEVLRQIQGDRSDDPA